MKINTLYRQQIINTLYPQFTDSVDGARHLWETMAAQLVLIVGEGGFNSLYARAVSLIQPTFPWLKDNLQSAQADNWLTTLMLNLGGQPPEQASAANCLLLTTFTDILASLIGEDLTIKLLQSAWGICAVDLSSQEINDEQ